MTLPPPIYDLMLLLDPQAEDSVREKIVADARSAIEADGELVRDDDWGERALAYPIERKGSADYHLLQFHAGAPELLSSLDRSLRITDGVVRFRLIKLKPGVPEAPDMGAAQAPPRRAEPEAPAAETPAAAETPPPRHPPRPRTRPPPQQTDRPTRQTHLRAPSMRPLRRPAGRPRARHPATRRSRSRPRQDRSASAAAGNPPFAPATPVIRSPHELG